MDRLKIDGQNRKQHEDPLPQIFRSPEYRNVEAT